MNRPVRNPVKSESYEEVACSVLGVLSFTVSSVELVYSNISNHCDVKVECMVYFVSMSPCSVLGVFLFAVSQVEPAVTF